MRRYFMVNGPLGGNMGTPPVEPQPPQVSFTTTAESRGGFNNFLKSIPQTTAMTPIPPLGSSPMPPMVGNPMGNIDIFNQPPSMGMGMMGMNQPQMQQPMQPPMQNPMMGGLMGKPIQNFFDGGGVDDFSDFGGFSDSSDPFGGGDSFNDSNDTSDPSIGSDSEFNEQNFQNALDNLNTGSDSDDSMFSDDPAIVDRRGINVGLENTGGFTAGVVPNLRGERFARFESVPFAQRALGRDFQTKIGNNPNLTAGDYFETFTPSSENPGGTGNRMADFTRATGKGPNDILSINDMNNIMDIQGKYEAGIRNNPAGQIEKISTTVPMNDDKQIASILDNLDLSKNLALDNERKSFVQSQPDGALKNTIFDYVPDAFQISNFLSQRGNQAPTGVAPVGTQGSGSRGDTIQSIPQVDSFGDPARVDPNVMTESAIKTGTGNIAGMDENTFRSLSSDAQQQILNDIRAADLGTTFTPYDSQPNFGIVPDTALETMAGRRDILPDQIFDIDTTDTRNFVGDDFQPALDLIDRRQELATIDAMNQDFNKIDRAEDPSTVGDDAFDDSTFIEENPLNMVEAGVPSIEAPKEFRDPFPNAGIGAIPTLTSLANKFSAYSRGRVLDSIDQKGYTPVYDGDVIVGAKNKFGQLMEGMDPNAPTDSGSDDNPLIIRPIAKAEEEEKEEEKLPNVIGGGETPAPVSSGSVVVDSPFTTSVGDYKPVGFDDGDLNDLIARLLKTSNPRAMKQGGVAEYAGGGRVMQALDNLLATG